MAVNMEETGFEEVAANVYDMNDVAEDLPAATAGSPVAGLMATMEIAGAESIKGANPDKTILGFAREY